MLPPDASRLLQRVPANTLNEVFAHASALPAGRYLHWDELRHRPPPANLTSEQWWLAVWFGRQSLLKDLPLLDRNGRAFRFATPEPILIDLHHIDRDAAGHIRSPEATPIHESRERYLLHSLIEESITSSQLEGAATTRRVAEAMLREQRRPRDVGESMIFNNYQAMEHVRALGDQPITPDGILELHRIITLDTLEDASHAGRLRRSDDVNVVGRRDGTVLHEPPRHAELPERLERLCAFANAGIDEAPFVHPVLRAILLHFMVGYDHPFVDGNGRTARALFYWSMARSGYWLTEFLSISQFLRRAPRQYMQAYLHTESDGNDTTYFLLHQLTTVRRAIDALYGYLARKTQEQRDGMAVLRSVGGGRLNHRQVALLAHALRKPEQAYRVAEHRAVHDVVYQTARSDLLGLEALGLLERMKQGPAFVFFAPSNLRQRLQALAKGAA